MHRQYHYYEDARGRRPSSRRPYGCLHFLFDLVMIACTGGLWLVWIFVREMRNR